MLLGVVLLLTGCVPLPYVPPDADTETLCRLACDNMERLEVPGWEGSPGVDEVYGTDDDVACSVVCVDTETAGYPFNARCIAGAGTRVDAEGCNE